MADSKISALTALTGQDAASDDVLAIVDTSATQTKKVRHDELFQSSNSLSAKAVAAGAGNALTVLGGSGVSANGNGGDVVINPGAKHGSGNDGRVGLGVRGGAATSYINVATANELRIIDSGGTNNGRLRCGIIFAGGSGSGSANVVVNTSNSGLELTNTWSVSWTSGNAEGTGPDAFLKRAAAGVVTFQSASSAAGGFAGPARTPAQITADQNDYSPGVGLFQRWSSDASRNVTGMVAGQDGEVRFVWNVGAQNIVFVNESASSTAANRFACSTGANQTLPTLRCLRAMYDATSSRWRTTLLP